MTEIEKVKQGLKCHLRQSTKGEVDCSECPYNHNEMNEITTLDECLRLLYEDAILLIDDVVNVMKLLEA